MNKNEEIEVIRVNQEESQNKKTYHEFKFKTKPTSWLTIILNILWLALLIYLFFVFLSFFFVIIGIVALVLFVFWLLKKLG